MNDSIQRNIRAAIHLFTVMAILVACPTTHATTLFTTVADTGCDAKIVSISQSPGGIDIYAYKFRRHNFAFMVITDKTIVVDCHVPTILIRGEIYERSSYQSDIYACGETIGDIDYNMNDGWTYSQYLGWINISRYPNVYSSTDGWMYIHEEENDVYCLYNYGNDTWTIRDLRHEWNTRNTIQ